MSNTQMSIIFILAISQILLYFFRNKSNKFSYDLSYDLSYLVIVGFTFFILVSVTHSNNKFVKGNIICPKYKKVEVYIKEN